MYTFVTWKACCVQYVAYFAAHLTHNTSVCNYGRRYNVIAYKQDRNKIQNPELATESLQFVGAC